MSTLHNYLRVEIVEPSRQTAGGLVLPDKAVAQPRWGKVLEVGPGVPDITGRPLPVPFQPGDLVYFFAYAPVECDLTDMEPGGGVSYFVSEGDVLLRIPAGTPIDQLDEQTILQHLQPAGNWCLIELIDPPERRSAGGIIIPDSARSKPVFARIIAPGEGLRTFGASLTSLVNRELLEFLKLRLPQDVHAIVDQFAQELEDRIPYVAPLSVSRGDIVILIPGRASELDLSDLGIHTTYHLIQEGDILKIYRRLSDDQ